MADRRLSKRRKEAAARVAGELCEYCRSLLRFSPDPFSIEHIVPRSRGGSDDPENLALSCQGCNGRKYTDVEALDPSTGMTAPLFHPRRHEWGEHFAWSVDFSLILGLTPTGRATVERLQLNRSGVIRLRQALASLGHHPPRIRR
jgi:hypothetical protein